MCLQRPIEVSLTWHMEQLPKADADRLFFKVTHTPAFMPGNARP
jgi:hypothetical protein